MLAHARPLWVFLWVCLTHLGGAAAWHTPVATSDEIALSVLYFATNGESWTDNSGWGGGELCSTTWVGVTCSGGAVVELNLEYNGLSQTIPTEVGLLTDLTANLRLGGNRYSGVRLTLIIRGILVHRILIPALYVSGTIPTQIGLIPLTSQLRLESSSLAGDIPTELGELNLMGGGFYLQDNILSGTVPSEIFLMTILSENFWISGNDLIGSIPSELGQLAAASIQLHFESNSLTGISKILCTRTVDRFLW